MIETHQTVTINAAIEPVWDYAHDMQRWASIMPGFQQCEIIDEDNSLWVLKVGVGAMVRTVKVQVCVDEWAGPERVDFSFKLKGDPVTGSGRYLARTTGTAQTEVDLHVQIEGTGPMAPMWEAMGAPVLPKFAKSFAEELKAKIEEHLGVAATESAATVQTGIIARIGAWLRAIWRAISGR